MKTEIIKEHNPIKHTTYPCLKIAKDGDIAIFVEPNKCVVLAGEGSSPNGLFYTNMNEDVFEPFNGVVQLSNS